ncbi:Protein of unknown function [Thermomonospora echinospora]|uniref:Uncharacterized protein n=1 Tax=Thermomonospora echinospora TaxID=1992 RepID=A0A1H6D936_9ACTN|nr:phosphatase PAP2 family protein [Thermomonospora echinospora]SEG81363.1 Protein of unknown function [Thermomonospora echinospora]
MTDDTSARPARGPRPSLRRELGLGLALFALYCLVDLIPAGGRVTVAEANGRVLYAWEHSLHIAVERPLNEWLVERETLTVLANYEYAVTYVVSAGLLLAWLYLRRPERYRAARNSFVLINLFGAAVFALWPVMPPRLLPDLGFVDTVVAEGTWGSWGTPLVDHANQLAAMPSLHVAWALWVSAELARLGVGRIPQAIGALHVLVTVFVIVATANHFVLDAVGSVVVVWVAMWVVDRGSRARDRVRPPDAFFLAVESEWAPQHVGGLIMLDAPEGALTVADLAASVRARLDELPRLRQRLSPSVRFRRPRWVDHPDLDWDWHVTAMTLPSPGGDERLDGLVAALQTEPLPRDRPLWRLILVRGHAPDRTAVIFLMHHVVADGMGVIAHALRIAGADGERPPTAAPARRVVGTAVGLVQLAADRRPQGARLPESGPGRRSFGSFRVPLRTVRGIARKHRVRVTDVILCTVIAGLLRAGPRPAGPTLRVAVPLMTRTARTPLEGNHTAAVMVDLPCGPMAEVERLGLIAAATRRRLRTGTRALASAFVMQRLAWLMPPAAHAAFARQVYGGRSFQAVVSNLPALDAPVAFAGWPLLAAHPIVPTAAGAPLAVGALGWNGVLDFGVSADPALAADARALCHAMAEVLVELGTPDLPQAEPAQGR